MISYILTISLPGQVFIFLRQNVLLFEKLLTLAEIKYINIKHETLQKLCIGCGSCRYY
jgi:hypothetical protein